MTPSEPASGSLNGLVSCGRLLSLQGTGAGCMANSAEEIEELPGEEDDDALVAEEQPASETTEAKKRVCARLHADVAKICENEALNWRGTEISPSLVGSVAKFVTEYAEIVAKRLPDFGRHAKRKVVTADDVLLFLKPHPDFHARILEFNDKLNEEKEAKKRKREENKAKNPPKAKGTKEKKQKESAKEQLAREAHESE